MDKMYFTITNAHNIFHCDSYTSHCDSYTFHCTLQSQMHTIMYGFATSLSVLEDQKIPNRKV